MKKKYIAPLMILEDVNMEDLMISIESPTGTKVFKEEEGEEGAVADSRSFDLFEP